jgi:hypothetical protein
MKIHSFLPAILLFLVLPAQATIRTVCNVPSGVAQYNTIQAAIDASSSGDSIFVHGSSVAYAGFTITNKQLVIIGPGWIPDKIVNPAVHINTSISISGAASNNTEMQGFIFDATVNVNSSKPDNLRFIRNGFNESINLNQASTTYSGYLFESNYFNNRQILGIASSIYQNFMLQNNIFWLPSGNGLPTESISNFASSVNVWFNHNLWYGKDQSYTSCFNNTTGVLLTNNIFVRRDAAAGNSNSYFNNNITYVAGNNDPWLSNGNTNGGGNVSNQNPQMADMANILAGNFSPLFNFTIGAGPANNSGDDSKDMGLLYDATGSLNWIISRNSRLPFIYSMIVTTPNVAAGGNVQVTVEARRNN